ncbi:transcriptional regulator, partial [archaeon]
MKTLCEIVVSDIMPTLRALITGDLMKTYGFNQVEVSERLGITQPAVSQYRRGFRSAQASP